MTITCTNKSLLLAAVILAIGLGICGWFVSYGLVNHGSYNDVVTVKGLATHDVEADLVLWPIKHAATGDNLPAVQAELEANSARIKQYLKNKGLDEADIAGYKIEVTDNTAHPMRKTPATSWRKPSRCAPQRSTRWTKPLSRLVNC
jgi:hypothetical protein